MSRLAQGDCNFDEDLPASNDARELADIRDDLYRLDCPYVGNKRAIIRDISLSLKQNNVEFSTVLDLFSGSSVVSLFMKLCGKNVYFNDLLTSSYYNGLAFVENCDIFLTDEEIEFLRENDNPNKSDFVAKRFEERFTPTECQFLDNYRANVDTLLEKCVLNDREREIKKAVCLVTVEHYIMDRCFIGGRLNKGQILANLKHRLAHSRNKNDALSFRMKPVPLFTRKGPYTYSGANWDASQMLTESLKWSPKPELLYLDPPYGQAQSDYASMFAFCEEYVYSKPLDQLEHIKKHSKSFVSKKEYEANFRSLLSKGIHIPTWVISFNATSFKAIDGIANLVKEFKPDVVTIDIDHTYRYRKDRGSAVEYLIIAR